MDGVGWMRVWWEGEGVVSLCSVIVCSVFIVEERLRQREKGCSLNLVVFIYGGVRSTDAPLTYARRATDRGVESAPCGAVLIRVLVPFCAALYLGVAYDKILFWPN